MRHELTGAGRIIRFDMRWLGKKFNYHAEGSLRRIPSGERIIVAGLHGASRFKWHAGPDVLNVVWYLPDYPVRIEVPDHNVRGRVFYREGFAPDATVRVCILENGHVTQRAAGPLDSEDWE